MTAHEDAPAGTAGGVAPGGGIAAAGPGLTTRDRMRLVYDHREPDVVPVTDWYWESTLERWLGEGLPADRAAWPGELGVDLVAPFEGEPAFLDTSPRFERVVVEETDRYVIDRDEWGLTKKNFKPVSTTPQHLASLVHDRASWAEAKLRLVPAADRIDWAYVAERWPAWRAAGAWISVAPWFGYDIVSTRMVDTLTVLTALVDDPGWVRDMCDTTCDLALAQLDMLWDAGFTFDELLWYDDIAHRNGLFFDLPTWREVVAPYQRRTVEWAHRHGVRAQLHCCGDVRALLPELIDIGLDALNPLETRAGMDPVGMKREYGRDLVLRGGFNVERWADPDAAIAEIRRSVPTLVRDGGYVFASDHSVPQSVSLDGYRRIVAAARDAGRPGG